MQQDGTQDRPRLPLVSKGDLGLALTEPAHAILVRLLSAERNNRVLDRLADLATRLRPHKQRHLIDLYEALLGPHRDQMPRGEEYATALIATLLRQRMFYARLAKDKTWRPQLTIKGQDAIDNARDAGRGLVLWMLPQEMTSLLLRTCAHDSQWNLHHMSHWMHGQSVSRLGISLFNRRDCRIEDQFAKRLMMTEDTTNQALKDAGAILRGGGCVSFRGIGWAKKPIYFPFFDGHIHLAFGAPVLARRVGAAVFTVATTETADGYELAFEPMDVGKPRTLVDLGTDFVARLERAVLASPGLWPVKSRQWSPGAPPVQFGDRANASLANAPEPRAP